MAERYATTTRKDAVNPARIRLVVGIDPEMEAVLKSIQADLELATLSEALLVLARAGLEAAK